MWEQQRSSHEASLYTHIHRLFTCYNGCLSATTPPPTPHSGVRAAHEGAFPCPTCRMSSRSFIFSNFYRVGPEILWHD